MQKYPWKCDICICKFPLKRNIWLSFYVISLQCIHSKRAQHRGWKAASLQLPAAVSVHQSDPQTWNMGDCPAYGTLCPSGEISPAEILVWISGIHLLCQRTQLCMQLPGLMDIWWRLSPRYCVRTEMGSFWRSSVLTGWPCSLRFPQKWWFL